MESIIDTENKAQQHVQYSNLFENTTYLPGQPHITDLAQLAQIDNVDMKRVCLKAGTEVGCHKTPCRVLICWLQGRATMTAEGVSYEMKPGILLQMAANTDHGVTALEDSVFLVFKIRGN